MRKPIEPVGLVSILMFFVFTGITLLGVVGSFINIGLTELQIFTFICGGGISWSLWCIAWVMGEATKEIIKRMK
jgi:hypothetical protein